MKEAIGKEPLEIVVKDEAGKVIGRLDTDVFLKQMQKEGLSKTASLADCVKKYNETRKEKASIELKESNKCLGEGMDISNLFDMNVIKKEVASWKGEIKAHPDWYEMEGDEGRYEIILDTIAPAAHGVHAGETVIEFFGPEKMGYGQDDDGKWFHTENPEEKFDDLSYDEWHIDAIDNYANKVDEELNKALGDSEVTLYLGWREGDYGLMMIYEPEEPFKKQEESSNKLANLFESVAKNDIRGDKISSIYLQKQAEKHGISLKNEEKNSIKHRFLSYISEKKESDPSLKPPKKWFDRMEKQIKKENPDYSADQVKATVGSIWYKNLKKSKKSEIRGREGKTFGKAHESINESKRDDSRIAKWFEGVSGGAAPDSFWTDGKMAYSYNTIIAKIAGKKVYVNMTKYTATTAGLVNSIKRVASNAGFTVVEKNEAFFDTSMPIKFGAKGDVASGEIQEGKDTDISDYVLRFINTRHNGDAVEARKAMDWLKKKLGSKYDKVLMKHGDPDVPGNFEKVRAAWEKESFGESKNVNETDRKSWSDAIEIQDVAQFEEALKDGPVAWPGMYPKYFATADGAALSYEAAKANQDLIKAAISDSGSDKQWEVIAVAINYEDNDLYCADTGKKIESAYGDDESKDVDEAKKPSKPKKPVKVDWEEKAVIKELVAQFGKEFKEEIESSFELYKGRWESFGQCAKFEADGQEYNLISSEEEAKVIAQKYVEEQLGSEPETFNQDFLQQHIYITDTDRRIIGGEEADAAAENIKDDLLHERYEEVFEAIDLKEEWSEWEEKIDKAQDQDRESDDTEYESKVVKELETYLEGKIEDWISDRSDEIEEALKDLIQYFVHDHGMYSMEDLMKANFIGVDTEEAAKAAVSEDGWAYFLSLYDGNYDTTDHGLVFFKE